VPGGKAGIGVVAGVGVDVILGGESGESEEQNSQWSDAMEHGFMPDEKMNYIEKGHSLRDTKEHEGEKEFLISLFSCPLVFLRGQFSLCLCG
jgi:hypothetical protein